MLSTDGEVVETLRAWELHTGHLCVCTILRVISGGFSIALHRRSVRRH